jgi:hypothetical protein
MKESSQRAMAGLTPRVIAVSMRSGEKFTRKGARPSLESVRASSVVETMVIGVQFLGE